MNKQFTPTMGLLWGFSFCDGKGTRVTNETAGDIFANSHDWTWMHFTLSDHRARRYLESFTDAPATARALLLSNETRLQVHMASECAFGVLPDIERDFQGQSLGAGRLAFFLDARHLITVRHHPMRIVDDVREQVEGGLELGTPADAFVRINSQFIEVVEERTATLAQALDHIEDMVLSDREDIDKAGLGPLRRELSRYHREFLSLRGALTRAMTAKVATASCPISSRLQQLAQSAEDFDRDAAALNERARLLYEEMDSRIAAQTNRSLTALTILSTLLLPPTFIAGAFGMNVPTIPWANTPGGFWWATGLCTVVVALCWYGLKRLRIL